VNRYPAGYARDLARAYGFPPHAVELVGVWLGKQTKPLSFLVTPRFFEVEVIEGVRLRYWHPAPFDILCHEFSPIDPATPEARAKACAHYQHGGGCALRPKETCSEYLRALKQRRAP
jgi:hypothetical protein